MSVEGVCVPPAESPEAGAVDELLPQPASVVTDNTVAKKTAKSLFFILILLLVVVSSFLIV